MPSGPLPQTQTDFGWKIQVLGEQCGAGALEPKDLLWKIACVALDKLNNLSGLHPP